jgi:hypothetical protein
MAKTAFGSILNEASKVAFLSEVEESSQAK